MTASFRAHGSMTGPRSLHRRPPAAPTYPQSPSAECGESSRHLGRTASPVMSGKASTGGALHTRAPGTDRPPASTMADQVHCLEHRGLSAAPESSGSTSIGLACLCRNCSQGGDNDPGGVSWATGKPRGRSGSTRARGRRRGPWPGCPRPDSANAIVAAVALRFLSECDSRRDGRDSRQSHGCRATAAATAA
jgi:hypothetical protein